jgi:Zn-finger protein
MGKSFSRKSHLVRLGIVLVLAFTAFLVARTLAKPPSWNDVVWYRADSLDDMKKLPLIYGGNESCGSCHGTELEVQLGPGHLNLSCESCHGPLADHVLVDKKIGDAIVINESAWQCMNCHSIQINRPAGFPLYRYQHGEIEVRKRKSKKGGKFCLDCHDPHAPELQNPVI